MKHEKDVAGQNLIAVYEKYGFVQLVSRPTRVTDHSATLIDHVYTNDLLNTLSCHVLTVNVSDHLATLTTLTLGGTAGRRTMSSESEKVPSFRRFNASAHAEFKRKIESETWSEVHREINANDQYDKFSEIYSKHYDQAYPEMKSGPKRKNERRDPKPWILPWLEDACARRQRLYHDKIKFSSATNIAAYKKIDKFCNKHINLAKTKYYKNFFEEYRDNSKKQWQLINSLLNRNVKRTLGQLS